MEFFSNFYHLKSERTVDRAQKNVIPIAVATVVSSTVTNTDYNSNDELKVPKFWST
jgi:hypothetical protein